MPSSIALIIGQADAMDVSIIMCSFNTRNITLEAIAAVYQHTVNVDFELIIIDNASSDGSAQAIRQAYPEAILIQSDENLGFAKANNVAAEKATGEYLLLLNPDTRLLNNAVQFSLDFARRHPEYKIVGGKTFYPDMTLNPTAAYGATTVRSLLFGALGFSSLFRRSRFFNPGELTWWSWDSPREVEMVTGCFLLIGHSLWKELQGFDESYFMYGEDADLCQRVRIRGGKCAITTDAQLIHHGGASEKVRAAKMVRLFCAKALLYSKPGSPIPGWYGRAMLSLNAATRTWALAIISILLPAKRESFQTWKDIWSQRERWQLSALQKSFS